MNNLVTTPMHLLANLHLASCEITLLITACITLLSSLFLQSRFKNIAYHCAMIGLGIALIFSILLLNLSPNITIFNGLFINDSLANLMKIFILLTVFLSFLYTKNYVETFNMPQGDYFVLGLFSTLGMVVLVSAHSLLTLYLGLELLSLPLYAMVAIRRTESITTEAALKYFVTGAIASGMFLYGLSLLYGATGQLDLTAIAEAIPNNWQEKHLLLSFALVFLVAGVGFKIASMPFHLWAPDVYEGAPSAVTLFISAAPKIAALAMAFRLFAYMMIDLSSQWQQLLLVMALLSTGFGNLLAVAQTNIRRLLAYSAIAHAGYALFGLVAMHTNGYAAALFYILTYALMSVAAFGLIVMLAHKGYEINKVSDLRGLNKIHPGIAFMLLIVFFSMAGIPPTVGFFGKLLVLNALVEAQLTWVAILGLFFAVIGAYYYLRLIKYMYFDSPKHTILISLPKATHVIFSLNCLSLVYLGIFPTGLVNLCINAFN